MAKQSIRLSDHFTYGKLLRFTLPSICMMVFTSIYGVVDGLFVSNFVGKTPFAAVNLVMPFVMILGGMGFMIGTGGTALVSKLLGEGKQDEAHRTFSMLVLFTLLLGAVLSAVGIITMPAVSRLLGASDAMMPDCVLYGRIVTGFTFAFMLQNVFQSFFIAAEKPRLGLFVTVAAGITNMVLDVVLVGMLHGGVEGAAIATFISQAVGGVLPVFYFLNKRSTSSIHLGRAQWNGGVIRSACINGSSELMTNLSMSLVNILYNYQLLRFAGENGVAAYGVIMYAAFLFVAVFVGYAVGSAPIVSYHYGARNHAELNNLYSKSLRLIGVIAVVMTALSMLVIPYVARIFVGYDAELLALTSHAFRVYALNFFLMGFNVYGSSFFTALGDGVTSALISFLRTLLFQLLALIFLPMVLGIEGVWLAVTAAEAGALCVTALMFITKDKVFHYRKASC